ncbi:beta-1,3-galactosyltransferase 5-like [Ostrea edulis]|uniref:beta-1,3-galactosyltransferase 5-like n=1 Tax=Ostrea edulis TaxID=37623 RepID=UPI002095017B|nr:beta-1,3-galactosyltransferase 5-like [Ostrea edulis]
MVAWGIRRCILKQLAVPFRIENLIYLSATLLTIIVMQTIFLTRKWTHPVQNTATVNQEIPSTKVSKFPSASYSMESTTRQTLVSLRPDVCNECFVHDYSYIMDNEDICSTEGNMTKVHTLVLITTAHQNTDRRAALRDTWLSLTRQNTADVRYAFLLGFTPNIKIQIAVQRENLFYRDIIQEDFIDTYHNLTLKTMMGFKWASTKCKDAKFVMKTDDDMFVNLISLKKIIRKNENTLQKSIAGFCNLIRIPIREKSSKWYMSYENYPHKKYPVYCSGTGYVTSMNVVHRVYNVSKNIPFVFLEDVYVSLCMRKLGFNMIHMEGFNTVPLKPGCMYKTNKIVTSHRVPPKIMRNIWRNCKDNNTSSAP